MMFNILRLETIEINYIFEDHFRSLKQTNGMEITVISFLF